MLISNIVSQSTNLQEPRISRTEPGFERPLQKNFPVFKTLAGCLEKCQKVK